MFLKDYEQGYFHYSSLSITFVEKQPMAGNSFGTIFKLTTFGESHGPAIGGIIDGCSAGLSLDFEAINAEMQRRKPGQSAIVTQRKEEDEVKFLSGIFEGKTTGTPIGFIIENTDQKSKDYSHIKGIYRPSHADYTYDKKYGIRDYRGGGRSSARETACRVVAGAIAKQLLQGIKITAYVSSVGKIELKKHIPKLIFRKSKKTQYDVPMPKWLQKWRILLNPFEKKGIPLAEPLAVLFKMFPLVWANQFLINYTQNWVRQCFQ